MKIIEDAGSGHTRPEFPFAKVQRLLVVEAAASVAERSTIGIVETYTDAAGEEAGPVVGACFEAVSGVGLDAFAAQ